MSPGAGHGLAPTGTPGQFRAGIFVPFDLDRMLRLSLVLILWMVFVAVETAVAQLRLEGEIDGRIFVPVAVDANGLHLRNGDEVRDASTEVQWRIEGDLWAHSELVRWGPEYTITADETQRDPAWPWLLTMSLDDATVPWPALATIKDGGLRGKVAAQLKSSDPWRQDWPAFRQEHGALVFGWLPREGPLEVVSVSPVPLATAGPFRLCVQHRLAGPEPAGQAVVLWWSNGNFVPSIPLFENPRHQQALLAVMRDDAAALERLAFARARSREGDTLLHHAARAGQAGAVAVLLRQKADPRARRAPGDGDSTPLAHAIATGRAGVAQMLLEGRSLDPGETTAAAILAARHGQLAAFDRVLSGAAHQPLHHVRDLRAAFQGARAAGNEPMIRRLAAIATEQNVTFAAVLGTADHPTNAEAIPVFARALQEQVGLGHLGIVRWLLEIAPVKSHQQWSGRSLLVEAARGGHGDIVELLLARGTSPDEVDALGETALYAAAAQNHAGIVELLLEHQADALRGPGAATTPLHAAAANGAIDVVQVLLAAGLEPNPKNRWNYRPLDLALVVGHGDVARQLIARGARFSPDAPDVTVMLENALVHDLTAPVADALAMGWQASSTFATTWPAAEVARIHGAQACLELLQQQEAPDSSRPAMLLVEHSELDEPLRLVQRLPPIEPRMPHERFPEQSVTLRCVVDAAGRTLFPRVLSTPDGRLVRAARDTAVQQRFHPPQRRGVAVATTAIVIITFPASATRAFRDTPEITPPVPWDRKMAMLPGERTPRGAAPLTVESTIGIDGRPDEFRVISSPSNDYTAAALLALRENRYRPATCRDVPVRFRLSTTFYYLNQR